MSDNDITQRIDRLEETLKESLTKLTTAVETLVKHEVEHKATVDTLARYGKKLDDHDDRIDVIEKKTPLYDLMVKATWIVGGTILTLLTTGIVSSFFIFGGTPVA